MEQPDAIKASDKQLKRRAFIFCLFTRISGWLHLKLRLKYLFKNIVVSFCVFVQKFINFPPLPAFKSMTAFQQNVNIAGKQYLSSHLIRSAGKAAPTQAGSATPPYFLSQCLPFRYIPSGMRLAGNSQKHTGIFHETYKLYF